MALKLQWLPEPSAKGGWDSGHEFDYYYSDQACYNGFDRFGTIRASVTYQEHAYMPSKWRISNATDVSGASYEEREAGASKPTKIEAMLLAESLIEDEG